MGKKRGEYKKYLYDSNMVMPKSTHYKKIKTCHQIPSNNENDDEQQSTSEITINVNNDINFDNTSHQIDFEQDDVLEDIVNYCDNFDEVQIENDENSKMTKLEF
jgi:outer membrane protein OmpA-like peptidoglycan-associated protein